MDIVWQVAFIVIAVSFFLAMNKSFFSNLCWSNLFVGWAYIDFLGEDGLWT